MRFDALGRFGRALAVDVTRRQGPQVVANRVRTRGGKLVILPGTAEGWDASTYPFTNEAAGGAERLLLPWADKPVSYQLEGDRFVPNNSGAQATRMAAISTPVSAGLLRSAASSTSDSPTQLPALIT